MSAAEPLTVGEKLSSVPRGQLWTAAVLLPCMVVVVCLGEAYAIVHQTNPSFFISVRWRLPLLISWGVYMSLISSVTSYVRLFLPHTPVAVDEAVQCVGLAVVGISLAVIESFVFAIVKDNRVVMAFTCVFPVFVVAVLVLWAGWFGRNRRPPADLPL